MANKKWYDFVFEGVSKSGAHVGPTPVRGYAESASDAKKIASDRFKESKNVLHITSSKNKK